MNKIKWRPATAEDIGMLARFLFENTRIPTYGVLTDVDRDITTGRTLFTRGGAVVFHEAEVPERELYDEDNWT